jgi:lysophospholipase L1-like esterase
MLFQPAQKIVFIGDSITDCGRQSGATAPYGDGYVSMVRNFLLARYPDRGLNIVNKGIGGNTVRDLDQRWAQDVLAEKPNWLSVCIGINDVWRHFDGNTAAAVPVEEYRATLHRLLKQSHDTLGAKLILAEPYIIEPNRNDPMRRLMEVYAATMRGIALEFGAVVVPTQAAFDEALTHTPSSFWADDRIHPNGPGHAILALAFLRALEYAL